MTNKKKNLISQLSLICTIISFAASIAIGTWYVAAFELRVHDLEQEYIDMETQLNRIEKKMDEIYRMCQQAKYIKMLGGVNNER